MCLELKLRNFSLGALAWELQLWNFSSLISLGTLAKELYLRNFSSGILAQELQFGKFSLGASAQELQLCNFSFGTLAQGLTLELWLRNFSLKYILQQFEPIAIILTYISRIQSVQSRPHISISTMISNILIILKQIRTSL